jgi:hypothetical protein
VGVYAAEQVLAQVHVFEGLGDLQDALGDEAGVIRGGAHVGLGLTH